MTIKKLHRAYNLSASEQESHSISGPWGADGGMSGSAGGIGPACGTPPQTEPVLPHPVEVVRVDGHVANDNVCFLQPGEDPHQVLVRAMLWD